MRMKFNKSSQLLLVSAVSLLVAGIITACGTDTVDFVFVASSKAAGSNNYGEIDVFEINSVSGFMRQIRTSPFPSGGRNPVAETVSSDNTNLYVVNEDDSSIVQFLIGSDGKLYPQNTYDTTGNYSATGTESPVGIFPLAVTVSGTNLFVVNTYQPLTTCSSADPCAGSVGVFPILSAAQAQALTPPVPTDSLGTPATNPSTGTNYWPLTLPSSPNDVIVPTAVNALKSGTNVFVTGYDVSVTPNVGYIFGFTVGSGGVLTPLSASPHNMGVGATGLGVHPSAIASDTINGVSYVYVTDSTNGLLISYSVGASDLTRLGASATGNQPSAIVVDPQYLYAYVANSLDGTVSAYTIGSSGTLTSIGSFTAGLQPVAIGIDPSANHFLFTVNFLGNDISDFELSTTTGALTNAQSSPYTANAQPTAVAAIPHGHSSQ